MQKSSPALKRANDQYVGSGNRFYYCKVILLKSVILPVFFCFVFLIFLEFALFSRSLESVTLGRIAADVRRFLCL